MRTFLRLLRDDWRKNYRYHGGWRALARCWRGDARLRRGHAGAEPAAAPRLDVTVFSVVPEMSALWAAAFERVAAVRPRRVLLGDCSGGLGHGTGDTTIVPLLNRHHGEKLDLFFDRLCRAEVVLVTDDDIFWLDDEPLAWALERLAAEPDVAVVALRPKEVLSSVLRGKVERAMGSVLFIRREIWTREELAFRTVHPPHTDDMKWHYDTGEHAQVELERRGYRVLFGPEELRRHLVDFEGVSSWTLKMQKYDGDLRPAVAGVPVRQEKALQTVFVLRGLAEILAGLGLGERSRIVPAAILDRAQGVCEELLGPARAAELRREIEASIGRLRERLAAFDAADLGGSVRRMLGS